MLQGPGTLPIPQKNRAGVELLPPARAVRDLTDVGDVLAVVVQTKRAVAGRLRVSDRFQDLTRLVGEDRRRQVERHSLRERCAFHQSDQHKRCGSGDRQQGYADDGPQLPLAARCGNHFGRWRLARRNRGRQRVAPWERGRELRRRGRALPRVALETARNHAFDDRIDPRPQFGGCGRCGTFFLLAQLRQRRRVERTLARVQLVEHQAERIQVAANRRALPGQLLRRHVRRRPAHLCRLRLVGGGDCETKVGNAHAAAPVDHHVRRLQIPVQHTTLMCRGQIRRRAAAQCRVPSRSRGTRCAAAATPGPPRRCIPSTGSAARSLRRCRTRGRCSGARAGE